MKHKIHYSIQSQRDMDEIWDYIFYELSSPTAAGEVIDEIMDAVDQLADFAELGAPINSITDVETDYRFLVCGSYLVLYRVRNGMVSIDRVLYGRRDYLRVLLEGAE